MHGELDLDARLRAIGFVTFYCSVSGEIVRGAEGDDWLVRLLSSAQLCTRALADAAASWNESTTPEAFELLSGVWAVPWALVVRRQVAGYAVTLLPSRALLESEQLHLLCQAAELDYELTRRQLEMLPVVHETDVPRCVRMVADAQRAEQQVSGDRSALETISRELGESYEEISLLYTMIQSMRSVDQPDRFLSIACEELLATLSYRWIGALLIDDADQINRLSGRFISAGTFPSSAAEVRSLMAALLETAEPDAPRVLQPQIDPDQAFYAPLGNASLVHPITSEGRVLGVMVAGDKVGETPRRRRRT